MFRKHVEALSKKDTKAKTEALAKIQESIEAGKVDPGEISQLFKNLVKCVQDNNFRVCLSSLGCLRELCQQWGDDCHNHIHELIPGLIKRSGDSRQDVRDSVIETIIVAMELVGHIKMFQKRIEPALRSPKWRVRQSMAICFTEMVRVFGPFDMNGLSGGLTDLLSDSQKDVRDAAMEAMRPLQKCLGKSLIDILTGGGVRKSLIKIVQQRLEAASPAGAESGTRRVSNFDPARGARPSSRGSARPASRSSRSSTPRHPLTDHGAASNAQSNASSKRGGHASHPEGGRGSATHRDNGATSPALASERAIGKEMVKIRRILGNVKDHDAWVHRRDSLIRLRELLRSGAANSPAFADAFLGLKSELTLSCGDLRSAIVKEACDTVAFAALCFGQRIEPMLPELFDVLLSLTVNSKQIMADAGHDCIRTVIMATQKGFARILPQLFAAAESRSAVLSTNALIYIAMALQQWAPHSFRHHLQPLSGCVRSALSNSCNETRQAARQAFFKLSTIFPQIGEDVLSSVDVSVVRQLEVTREEDMFFESKFADVEVPQDGYTEPSPRPSADPVAAAAPAPRPLKQRKLPKPKKKTVPRKVFKDRWDDDEAQSTGPSGLPEPTFVDTEEQSSNARHRIGGARRTIAPQPRVQSQEEKPRNEFPERDAAAPRAQRAQRVLPAAERAHNGHGRSEAPRHEHAGADRGRQSYDVALAVDTLRKGSWADKAAQYRSLCRALMDGELETPGVAKVLRELSKSGSLDREHPKVISGMLTFVVDLFAQIESAPAIVKPHVDSVLPNFICLMAHAKDLIRNLAADTLECFVEHYSFSELFPSIERVLSSHNVRSQEVGLVVLMDCLAVAASQQHTLSQSVVTQILKKLLSLPKVALRGNQQIAEITKEILSKVFNDMGTAAQARNSVHRLSRSQVDTLKLLLPNNDFFVHSASPTSQPDLDTPSQSSPREVTTAPVEAVTASRPVVDSNVDSTTQKLQEHLYLVHTQDHIDDSVLSYADDALQVLNDSNGEIQLMKQEVALHLLRQIAASKPQSLLERQEPAIGIITSFYASLPHPVNKSLDNLVHFTVSDVARVIEPVDSIQLLLHACFVSDLSPDQQMYMFLFCIQGLFLRCDRQRLRSLIHDILPILVEGAHHTRSDIRKCSIVALAELSVSLGSLVETSLAQTWNGRSLSDVHFQLIWHFSKRIGNGAGHGGNNQHEPTRVMQRQH